jgi:ATP-dependent protease ClpP protease subunit
LVKEGVPDDAPKTPPLAVGDGSAIDSACPSYTSILEEHNVAEKQREIRKVLLRKMASKEFNNGQKAAVITHITKEGSMGSGLETGDIPVLGNVLRKVGDVDILNLILHSPGGDGTCVEKFVSLCRNQCKHFRVIIPNMAKSAATMIALGADQIVMGPPSELGPIDAQVPVVVAGIPKYISAQSFIDARDSLLEKYKEARLKKEDTKPILQMIASLDIAHIEECQRMMDFGRAVVRKLLEKHMFHREKKRNAHITRVVKMLSSVKTHLVHGRQIDGATARKELKLNVKLLAKDDKFWQLIWEYYTRAEIHLGAMTSPKMFETEYEALSASGVR